MRKHYPLNSNGAEDAGRLPWIDGVPSTGVEGSYPGQALFTDTEAEILAAIDASGQTRNGSDLTQLIQAVARGIYVGQFGGTPNALACALPNNVVFASLVRGIRLGGFVTATNATVSGSAGVTVALAGIGAASGIVTAPLLRKNGTALQAGDLPVNQDFDIRWDGSAFRMAGSVASDGGGSGSGSGSGLVLPQWIEFFSGTTWSWLATTTEAFVEWVGGGASGAGSNVAPCAGAGGAGSRILAHVTGITKGALQQGLIGQGGASIAANTVANGNNGGPTTGFGRSAGGGSGGIALTGSTPAATGGAGGVPSGLTGDTVFYGEDGQAGANSSVSNYPRGGGTPGWGGGGTNNTGTGQPALIGLDGLAPGAGGGGGYNTVRSGAGHIGCLRILPILGT